uniref:Uncharacterized protein n=1 Tax=Oryza brachyantha TaxID=4533 RepID=J3M2W3_ORYBR
MELKTQQACLSCSFWMTSAKNNQMSTRIIKRSIVSNKRNGCYSTQTLKRWTKNRIYRW